MIKTVSRQDRAAVRKVTPDVIEGFISDLGSQDGLVRVKARKTLVGLGHEAVKPLVKSLSSKKPWLRWEVTKALSQIADPTATHALIDALEDKAFDVRWLAAEGLIHIGHDALIPLLQAVVNHGDSLSVREGVHHVLHDIEGGHYNKTLAPLLEALEGFEPSVEAPLAAKRALEAIRAAGKLVRRL